MKIQNPKEQIAQLKIYGVDYSYQADKVTLSPGI